MRRIESRPSLKQNKLQPDTLYPWRSCLVSHSSMTTDTVLQQCFHSMLLSGDFLSCICRLYITDALQSEPGENIGALLAQRDWDLFFSQWVIIYLFITYYVFLYCINSHLQSENHTCSNHSSCSCRACTCPHAPWDCHNNQMHILKGGKNTRKVNKFEGWGVCCKDEDANDVRLPLTSDSTVTMFTQTFHHSWANIEAGQCKTKTKSEGLHIHAKQGKGKLCRKSRT